MSMIDAFDVANKILHAGLADGSDRAFREAAVRMEPVVERFPDHWYVRYVSGQCLRLSGQIPEAVEQLRRAAAAGPDEQQVFLALGIALQLTEQYDDAIVALSRAIEIDPDFATAYNSLALTQRKRGELCKAIENYHLGAVALGRGIAVDLIRQRKGQYHPFPATPGELWLEYAGAAALDIAMRDGLQHMAWPSGEEARDLDARRDGRYFQDSTTTSGGESIRTYLPNYFNTFFHHLTGDRRFADFIGNRGVALESAGFEQEARQHIEEAPLYLPTS
jgi:tetratricopeptide (TPR) repeat protein